MVLSRFCVKGQIFFSLLQRPVRKTPVVIEGSVLRPSTATGVTVLKVFMETSVNTVSNKINVLLFLWCFIYLFKVIQTMSN